MNGTLTLDEVLDASLPAFGGEIYRYAPDKGFFRATTARFAPSWLPIPWPAHGDQVAWTHGETCVCRFCDPPTMQMTIIHSEPEAEETHLVKTA